MRDEILQMPGVVHKNDHLSLSSSSSGNDSFGQERIRQFTFDYSYWSGDPADSRNCTQEKVFLRRFNFLHSYHE